MKNIVFLLCLLGLLAVPSISAKKAGVGIILGDPTGLSFKLWQNQRFAIDIAAAWSFINENRLHLHADYLVHNYDSLRDYDLIWYYGLGVRVRLENPSWIGVRGPFGITHLIKGSPLDLFLELVPILNLAPATDFDLNAGLGIRFYFQ